MGKINWGYYSNLRPREIDEILKDTPVAYIPWGALEWHCHHAPIGLDSIKAENLCAAIAERTGGVVLPAIPFGVNTIKPFKGFRHSLDISDSLVSRVAEELCSELADEGFRIVVILTGHYPPEQLEALESGANWARERNGGVQFLVWGDHQLIGESFNADHAGATETSFLMHFTPDMIKTKELPDRPVTLDGDGIMGEDPREASAERGKQQTKIAVDSAVTKIQPLLEQLQNSE